MPFTLRTEPNSGRLWLQLESENFIVRTASVDDVSERWAGWLNDPVAATMLNARPRSFTLDELRQHVRSFDNIERILACIFHRGSGRHIGIAIGEYLDGGRKARPAVLIGEPEFRSMGLLNEMELIAYELYFEALKVDAIVSNVLAYNEIAIAFNESRGWRLVHRVKGAKRSARTGEPIDVLVYEFTREMWEKKKAE
ncbi:MAG: hypothetical protein AB7F36_08020, partial [Reyranellaceae bacterium]